MKFIVLLVAIFAIATARVQPGVVYESFTTKLGLTQQQQAGIQTCALEIRNAALPLLAGGKAATQARLLAFLFADDTKHREVITTIIEKVQTELPACRQFVLDVASVFAKSTISNDERYFYPSQLTRYRLQKYAAEIISAVISTLEANARGNSQVVGENLATIVQLATGLAHPETLMEYVMKYEENHKDVIEISVLETDRLIQQTINIAAKELGSDKQVSEERVKELRESVESFVHTYINAIYKTRSATTFVDREVQALGAFRDLIKTGGVVAENVKLVVGTFVPAQGPMTKEQAKFVTAVVLRNYFLRLPTIQRRVVDLSIELRHHHAASSGKALAGLLKALFQLV